MGKYKKRGDSSAPPHAPHGKRLSRAAAALPKLQSEEKAELFRFPVTPDVSRPHGPLLGNLNTQHQKVESTRFSGPQSLPG